MNYTSRIFLMSNYTAFVCQSTNNRLLTTIWNLFCNKTFKKNILFSLEIESVSKGRSRGRGSENLKQTPCEHQAQFHNTEIMTWAEIKLDA